MKRKIMYSVVPSTKKGILFLLFTIILCLLTACNQSTVPELSAEKEPPEPELSDEKEPPEIKATDLSDAMYYVTFYNALNEPIGEVQYVKKGTAATAPTADEAKVDGYRFLGTWDKDFSAVASDLSIYGEYIQQFTVTFYNADNEIIGAPQTVDIGSSAIAPNEEERATDGYDFIDWDTSFTDVRENLTVRSVNALTGTLTETYVRDKNYIYFGTYPQSEVTDSTIVNALNNAIGNKKPATGNSNGWTSYKYYSGGSNTTDYMWYIDKDYNGEKYRGVYFTKYRSYRTSAGSSTVNNYQEENDYKTNNIYWFKYEPIKWRILEESDGYATILCEMIIDSQEYSSNNESSFSHNGGTGYANNYALSNIRKWLNETFYNTAFNDLQKKLIQTVTIDNRERSTYPDNSRTWWCSEMHTREVSGYNGSVVQVKYDDCNPFGVIAGDFGEEAWLFPPHASGSPSESTINAFKDLSESFVTFMENFIIPTDDTEYIPSITDAILKDYTLFYNKAMEIYKNSLVSFTKGIDSDISRSAVVGINKPYTMSFGGVNLTDIDLRTAMAHLFGFSSATDFANHAQNLVDICVPHKCSESFERIISGYNDSKVSVKYDDCNPFGMIAEDFGEIKNIPKHTTKTASGSIITAFVSLGELFSKFTKDTKTSTNSIQAIGAEDDAWDAYVKFYDKAIEIYQNSLVSFTKNTSTVLANSAVIGINHQSTIIFSKEKNRQDINYAKVIANIFGFSTEDELASYAQKLAYLYEEYREEKKNGNTEAYKALENGCFCTSDDSFIFPIAVQNESTSTILLYVILDASGLVSVWVNDITLALRATNFNETYFTDKSIHNELCCKNKLFITGTHSLENGCFYNSKNDYNTYIFPFAVQNELFSTALLCLILDSDGRVSVWVNDITVILWAINYNSNYHTSGAIHNELYCKKTLFVAGIGENAYACGNTNDKVWLLSEQEVSKAFYGFADPSINAQKREKQTTAYAQCQGAYTASGGSYDGNGYWWLRSPYHGHSNYALSVYEVGDAYRDDYVDHTYHGVVPALKIKLS